QIGMQRGERVIGNLGTCVRDGRDEGRLACVGHAQQADVGQHLQLEPEFTALAFLAVSLLTRRAVGRGLEVDVAPAALAAFGQYHGLTVFGHVGQNLAVVVVDDERTHGHAQDDVVGALAIAIRAAPVFAVFGAVQLGETIVDQRVDVAVGDGINAAAFAAIAAVGATEGAEFFAAERGATVAAVTGNDFYPGFVDEFHDVLFRRLLKPPQNDTGVLPYHQRDFAAESKKALPEGRAFGRRLKETACTGH